MDTLPLSREAILEQLERMLSSTTFAGAGRSSTLLRFLVEHAIDGKADRLKEYTLGAEALGKGDAFDPRTDPIVRAEASRLRTRMERYYASDGRGDALMITLPKGTYVPAFSIQHVPAPTSAVAERRSPWPVALPMWFAAGVVFVLLLVTLWLWNLRQPFADAVTTAQKFEVELPPPGWSLASDVGSDIALSDDGSRIVFVVSGPTGATRLMTRRLDQSDAVELPGTDGARVPFLSPDGRWVGFWAAGAVKKTAVTGGSPVLLCDATDLLGGAWSESGDIFVAMGGGSLSRIPGTGGAPVVVLDLAGDLTVPRWPQVLPGGKHILFTAVGASGPNAASIEAFSIADGTRTTLINGGTYGRYFDGYLTYVNQGTLFAQRFDLGRLQISGSPIAILDDVSYSSTFGFAHLDISRNGILAYRRSPARGPLVASFFDASGRTEPMLTSPADYTFPRLSPDGARLAVTATESGAKRVLLYDTRSGRVARLPSHPAAYASTWTPDGRFLVTGGSTGLHWITADDPRAFAPLTNSTAVQIPWSFSPDGTRLAYHQMSDSTGFDVWTVPVTLSPGGVTAGTPQPLLNTRAYETYPSFSPDGRWIAYGSGEEGKDVYVRRFPDDGRPGVQISARGGRIARWLPGGGELLYRADDHRLMVVAYAVKDGVFVPEPPRTWSSTRLGDTGVLSNFDLHPDGKRVVGLLSASAPANEQARNRVMFVLNLAAEIRQRLSPAK